MSRIGVLAAAALLAAGTGRAAASRDDRPAERACPARMILVRGGAFELGMREGYRATVADFCLDQTEVTVSAYAACARKGGCAKAPETANWPGMSEGSRAAWSKACNAERADRRDHPVNCVDWSQADAFCRAARKRLPTEEEWEWAARGGPQANPYPWGSAPPGDQVCWNRRANGSVDPKFSGTCRVGSHPAGDSPLGFKDMGGNVWEWTSSANKGGPERVSRGGGWYYNSPETASASYRGWQLPAVRGADLGFRCARTP